MVVQEARFKCVFEELKDRTVGKVVGIVLVDGLQAVMACVAVDVDWTSDETPELEQSRIG